VQLSREYSQIRVLHEPEWWSLIRWIVVHFLGDTTTTLGSHAAAKWETAWRTHSNIPRTMILACRSVTTEWKSWHKNAEFSATQCHHHRGVRVSVGEQQTIIGPASLCYTRPRMQYSISSANYIPLSFRFSSKPWPVRPSLWMWNHPTPSTTWRPRSKTRKESLQISNVLSLLESNWKTDELCRTTIFKKNPLFTWFWDCVEESTTLPSLSSQGDTTAKRLSAVSVTHVFHHVLRTAVRRNAATHPNFAQRRSLNKLICVCLSGMCDMLLWSVWEENLYCN